MSKKLLISNSIMWAAAILVDSNNAGNWIGVGTAIGAVIFAATNEPTWLAVGVSIGAALSWRKSKIKN